jgi:hypothetical protein
MNHRFPPSHNEYMPHQRMPHQEHGFAPGSFGGNGNGYQMNMGAGMGMGGYGTTANHPGLNPYQVQDYYGAPSATSPTGPNVPHGYPGPGPYAPRPVPHGHPDSGYGPPGAGMMSPPPPNFAMRSTLWMGNLEPWMDEDYVRQACSMFSWHPTEIRVPRPTEGEAGQPLPNNTGYCFISFATAGEAAAALARVTAVGPPPMMPNSQRPFNVDWADCVPTSTLAHHQSIASSAASSAAPKTQPEYSIFVGDLAPEATNSDLVAVFRNPILGLREDRRPKHVHPFHSCKSAKIMLDPVTGVSKGYGFVRFTDEADQQRALVEMHGLYCLSRPSTATSCLYCFTSLTIFYSAHLPCDCEEQSRGRPRCHVVLVWVIIRWKCRAFPWLFDCDEPGPADGTEQTRWHGASAPVAEADAPAGDDVRHCADGASARCPWRGAPGSDAGAGAAAKPVREHHRPERGAAHVVGPVQHDRLRRRPLASHRRGDPKEFLRAVRRDPLRQGPRRQALRLRSICPQVRRRTCHRGDERLPHRRLKNPS